MGLIFVLSTRSLWQFNVRKDFWIFWFGTVKLTENVDPDENKYSSYGTGFDASGGFSLSHGSGFSENVTIFGAAMSSYW